MALQNTDILLNAQKQALEGEKFKAWGDFAKERVGDDVAAIQKTLVARDKNYNESLASLDSDIKAQRLLSGDDADIVKELEDQKDEFLSLKRNLTRRYEGSESFIDANTKLKDIQAEVQKISEVQGAYTEGVTAFKEYMGDPTMQSGAVGETAKSQLMAYNNPKQSKFVINSVGDTNKYGRRFDYIDDHGNRIIKTVYDDGSVDAYMDTKFEGTADDLKEKGERDFDQDDFKLGDGYEKIESTQVSQLPSYFEPSNGTDNAYRAVVDETIKQSISGAMTPTDATAVLQERINSFVNEKNLKGVDLLSMMVDWESKGGERYVTTDSHKDLQAKWDATLDKLPQEERAKYNGMWFKNTEVPEGFNDDNGDPINIVSKARSELGGFLSQVTIPGLSPLIQQKQDEAHYKALLQTARTSSGPDRNKYINAANVISIEKKVNKMTTTPQHIIDATAGTQNAVKDGDVLATSVEDGINAALGPFASRLSFSVANSGPFEIDGTTYNSIEEMSLAFGGDVTGYNEAMNEYMILTEKNNATEYDEITQQSIATPDRGSVGGTQTTYGKFNILEPGKRVMLSFGTEITDISENLEFEKRGTGDDAEFKQSGLKETQKKKPSKYIYYTVPKGGFDSKQFETWLKQNMSNVMEKNGWVDAAVLQDFAFTPANTTMQVNRGTAPDLTDGN